ncbi:LacI family DNA-binding transcriptional regulator [Agromyces humatus]|uniref:LacI family DNA-binding transcriptional regulator n=1 Tax=Agromyces humatus TaxID=279573 RepID=A0ABN2KAG1_9MICO|nr:LacI family DNA-binding transcriptional regulator [Agromyces humatus]
MSHDEVLGDSDARRPTIYDVAKASKVSPSTVSRTFSKPGRVSAATADRIRRVADELEYHHVPHPRFTPTTKTGMLAVVVADLTNPFFLDIVQGARHEASMHRNTVLVIDAQESLDDEREAVGRVVPFVDGIVLAASRMREGSIRAVARQRALVVLNRPMPDVPSAVTDNARGMHLAVEHLSRLGHRTLTYLAGPEASWADSMRWRSIAEAATDHGLRVRRLGPFAPTAEGGGSAVEHYLARPTTGVVAYNDPMAMGFIEELAARGIRAPDDVSVIGFDDSFDPRFGDPVLTTVAVPHRILGRFAVQMLLGTRVAPAGRPAMLPAELVVRRSTGKPVDGAPHRLAS